MGAQLYTLSDRGVFHQVGTYGLEGIDTQEPLSQFADNPLSKAVATKTVWQGIAPIDHLSVATGEIPIIGSGQPLQLWAIALTRDNIPVGAMTVLSTNENPLAVEDRHAVKTLGNIGGLYMESIGVKNLYRDNSPSGNEITERQYEVLLGLARGETNADIARQLILSESSIKQETIRIYRSLGVTTREQAVAKARATGLIPDGVYPTPPPQTRLLSRGGN